MLFNPLKRATRRLGPIARSYEKRLEQLGPEARAVFWKSADHQLVRFEAMYGIFDDVDAAGGLTISDFGCGYGGFFEFLRDTPVLRRGRYIGYDMSEKMVAAGRQKYPDPRATFIHGVTVTEETDYTFACGTYNMHGGAAYGEWAAYVKASLAQIWRHTRKGLAFNLLRSDAPDPYSGLFYADGEEFLTFCRKKLSTDTTITNDDPMPDFTFFVRR